MSDKRKRKRDVNDNAGRDTVAKEERESDAQGDEEFAVVDASEVPLPKNDIVRGSEVELLVFDDEKKPVWVSAVIALIRNKSAASSSTSSASSSSSSSQSESQVADLLIHTSSPHQTKPMYDCLVSSSHFLCAAGCHPTRRGWHP